MPVHGRPAVSTFAVLLGTAACNDVPEGGGDAGLDAAVSSCPAPPALGQTMTLVADEQLFQPYDLAFNPRKADELWVVSHVDDSTIIITGATTDAPAQVYRRDAYAFHFMEEVTSIAFGADETSLGIPGTFATCQDSRNTYGGTAAPNDFMGPALWSSDLSIYAATDPHGLGSHLDMLHQTPRCMGIAHERDNVYWAFGGLDGAIYRNDFQEDHDVGQDDHSDGQISRWMPGEVARVDGIPSHLFWENDTLWIADTGNDRILALDTTSGTRGENLPMMELIDEFHAIDDASFRVVAEVERPAGMEVRDGLIYTTLSEESRIVALCDGGGEVWSFDTGLPPGSLGGLTFGPDDKLYFTDIAGDRVFRLDP